MVVLIAAAVALAAAPRRGSLSTAAMEAALDTNRESLREQRRRQQQLDQPADQAPPTGASPPA